MSKRVSALTIPFDVAGLNQRTFRYTGKPMILHNTTMTQHIIYREVIQWLKYGYHIARIQS